MNLTETRDLLETMALVWPNLHVDADMTATWTARLASVDAATATAAADRLVDGGREWPPTLSVMVDTCRRLAAELSRQTRAQRGICPKCDGNGWIEVGRDANQTIPCGDCLPWTQDRWKAGKDGYGGPVYTGGRPRKVSTETEMAEIGLHHAREVFADLQDPMTANAPRTDRSTP